MTVPIHLALFSCLLASCLMASSAEPVAIELEDPEHDCGFDRTVLSFAGDAGEQARCLLRPLERYGRSGPLLEQLPNFLERSVGAVIEAEGSQPLERLREALRHYLEERGIAEIEIGGDIFEPLSTTEAEFGPTVPARYFVLHDTSHPNLLDAPGFPADINQPSWPFNRVEQWQEGEQSKAHVFVGRDGSSTTAVPFSRGWRATKLEVKAVGEPSRGLFLHIEQVQPRRSDPEGPPGNDGVAPVPGFGPLQLERSALLYIVASVRAGRWLIPAYHHNVDAALVGAHDDPQNFPLDEWVTRAETIWSEMLEGEPNTGL